MINWKHIIAGFCVPINIIFIIAGIVIRDPFAIVLGSISIGLVLYPILGANNEKTKKDSTRLFWRVRYFNNS